MTALREVAGLDIEVNNRVSEGAAAAARDLEKVEAAADRAAAALKEVEAGTRLAGASFDKTAARSDAFAAAELRRTQILAGAERQIAALTAAAEREGRGADELAAAIAAVTARRDADIVKVAQQAAAQRAQQMALVGGASAQSQALASGALAMKDFIVANDNAASKSGRFGQAIGQAGFQLQDFVVQVGAGQNALVALGQQGSQMLGVFGTGGAIAGAVLAIAAMTANFLLGKSAAEQLTEALHGQEAQYRATNELADRMEASLRRQNAQYLGAAEAGARYRSGLQGLGEDLVRLARYYERLTEAQRESERVTLAGQQRALTAGGGPLQLDILRPLQGRIATAEGGTNVDLSGMAGLASQGSTSMENVPQELRGVTQAAIQFRDAGRITVEGFQQLINAVAAARAGSAEYRTELEAYEKRLIDMLPRVREYEEALRRVGVAQTAIDPANAAQVALEGMRGVTGEVGGTYQSRQRIQENRRRIQAGLASGLATDEDRMAGRSSLRTLAQQEQGLIPATQQQLRALDEQARLSMVAEGAARDLAQAEMDLDRAARASGAGMASASEKAQASALVQERLDRQLSQTVTNLDRQITGETAIAQSYAISAQEGRQMEAAVRATTEALKYGAEGTAEYASAVETLTVKYNDLNVAQAERQTAQRNTQSRDELAYLQREAELIGASADARERELAALRARQSAGAAAGSDAAKEAESLAARLVDARRNTEQLRNSWNELGNVGERAFENIGSSITQALTTGEAKAINFGNVWRGVMSEAAQAVLKLGVVNPVLNYAFGGMRGTLGGITQVAGLGNLGLGGSATGTPITDSSGSITGYIGQVGNLSSAQTVTGGLRGLNPGDYISGARPFNTGFSAVDGFLNTPLWGGASAGINAGGAATNAAGYGSMAANSIDMAGSASAAGVGSNVSTIGSVGAGALGVAGGLYGAYSGFERGGLGGYTQAAGGLATAGMSAYALAMGAMSAVPVAGWIGAALLAIAGALLPGQKPSAKGQEFRYDLGSGASEKRGLSGSRYSAENASQAEAATMQIASLAQQISTRLGGQQIGGEIAVGVTSSRGSGPGTLYLDISGKKGEFTNDETGAQQLADRAAQLIIEEFRSTAAGDYKGILSASPDVAMLDQNLTWYEQIYKSFQTGGAAVNEYAKQLDALNASMGAVAGKARDLGLATDDINAAWTKQQQQLEQQRNLQLSGYDIGLTIRSMQAGGADDSALQQQVALMQFDLGAAQQLEQAKSTLESLGLSAEDVAQRIVTNEQVLAQERLKIQQDYAAQAVSITKQQTEQATQSAATAISSLAEYTRGLAYSDKSALSVQDQYALASRQLNAVSGAAMASDANSLSQLQSYIEPFLAASRSMNGSGAAYAADYERVTEILDAVGKVSTDTLTASFAAEIAKTQTQTLVAELQSLRAEVTALRTQVAQGALTPARAA